ncbi:Scr1 family TA system antitoxin-like transcriptional regulator [Streptomyces aurantiogriseus]|uniref:DUF5753 domain-containing protein n=1 Tax=Streptomyces aurantiogriseus TaxID=66870 RepID=A0A918FN58_9ACTN|nr:Scr1 family TA system antitoxin-like transcriptional regulator [Streptomyces aurantiogriseus]GGR58342.1 hypothetical protein GCM10010251_88980 [Streptomyces aurantiogriseus]
MATYAGLDADARVLRSYESMFVHGLLQTEDRARAVIARSGPANPTKWTSRCASARNAGPCSRGSPLGTASGAEGERAAPAGRRQGGQGGPTRHLAEAATLPNATIQGEPFRVRLAVPYAELLGTESGPSDARRRLMRPDPLVRP